MTVAILRGLQPLLGQQSSLARLLIGLFTVASTITPSLSFAILPPKNFIPNSKTLHPFLMTNEMISEESTPTSPQWDPILQIYVGGVVPENAEVRTLIEQNHGYLRLFGYGSLCWNPGTGALSQPGVMTSLGRARGYKRCWAQKSTDHRGRPEFPGIVCTLLEDKEVGVLHSLSEGDNYLQQSEPTMTEGVIYLIPPEWVQECLDELDFREKGGYARDVIDVVEDDTGDIHQALLYRGTPDNPAFWSRAILDLPFAAAVMSVAEGPSGKNDVYLNSLDRFLSDTHTIDAENDDTTTLANMVRYFQTKSRLYFLFGSGSNQHNQLLLDRPNNAALLRNNGEDAHEQKEIVVCTPKRKDGNQDDEKPLKLFAGGGHSGLLSTHGKLYLWGWNGEGQCGNCVLKQGIDDPLPIVEPLADLLVETAALGFNHTLIIEKGTGKVFAFGSNERGQVTGTPSTPDRPFESTPIIPECLKNVQAVAVAAGLFHSAVLTKSGELITFGNSQFGQSLVHDRWKPNDGSRLVSVACGRRHTVVADEHARIWTFGENKYGQLGRPIDGKKFDATPTPVKGVPTFSTKGTSTNVVVDCGWSHTIVHFTTPNSRDSLVFGWGRNDKGQLGLGTRENVLSPISLFTDKTTRMVACGSEFTMLIDSDFRIWGCGWNEHGNLATNGTEDNLYLVETNGARIVAPPDVVNSTLTIAVGGAHCLAAKVMTNS